MKISQKLLETSKKTGILCLSFQFYLQLTIK